MLTLSAFFMACAFVVCGGTAAAQGVDVSSGTRLESVRATIRAREALAGYRLIGLYGGEPQPVIRAAIVRGVAAVGNPDAATFFRRALLDGSALVRLAAVEGLGRTRSASDLAGVLAREDNAGVRHAAAVALGSIKTAEASAALEAALAGDANPNVRIQAARSLRRHGARGKQSARKASADKDKRVRAIALEP